MPTRGRVYGRCPKCGGNLFPDKDRFGDYAQCLQCGYVRYLVTASKAHSQARNSLGTPLPKTLDILT